MRHSSLVSLALLTVVPSVACAQIRASEHFTLTQKVSSTTITMEGDRPVARGRTLFGDGGVVKWGEVWTPGANWATTIEVDRDVKVDGQPLPKGKYSLWLTPAQSGGEAVPHAASRGHGRAASPLGEARAGRDAHGDPRLVSPRRHS